MVVEGLLEPLSYTYDIAKNNTSGLTIQGLSTESRQRFAVCDDECPFPDYEKFLTYYDNSEYADQWIISAFDGKETQLGRGRADFASMGQEGRFGTLISLVCVCVCLFVFFFFFPPPVVVCAVNRFFDFVLFLV